MVVDFGVDDDDEEEEEEEDNDRPVWPTWAEGVLSGFRVSRFQGFQDF